MQEIKTKVYRLETESGDGLGQIVITSNGMFSGVTDYGNLSFMWGSGTGKSDFREFILSLNTEYFAGKMQNGLSYICYNANTSDACKRFSERILPPLQEAIRKDMIDNPEWL